MWIFFWVLFFGGVLVIACGAYDWFDRKKHSRPRKVWKYALAVVIGLMLMLPVGYTFVYDFLFRPLLPFLQS